MKISEFLREDLVTDALKASDKASAIDELCALVAARRPDLSATVLAEVLSEREKLGSTGVGEGVAIPHGKLGALTGLVAAFGRTVQGVEFNAIDGRPTHLFFVLFAPENSAGIHLKALARISRLFKSAAFRSAILEAKDAAGIYKLIADEDARY